MSIKANYQQQHVWREKYLVIIGGFLAVFQLLLSLTVEGCELYGDFIHFPRMNIFIGHAAFPMFTCAWISLAAANDCTSYAHTIYDSYYLYSNSTYNYIFDLSNTATLYGIKVPLIKGQLAAGILMLVTSIIYFILYGITDCRARNAIPSIQYSNPAYTPTAPVVLVESAMSAVNSMKCPHCQTVLQVTITTNP